MSNLLDIALSWHAAGHAPLPIKPDGSKSPAVKWTNYTNQQPTEAEVRRWFTSADTDGLGLVCGSASGGLEMLEVEGRAIALATELRELMSDNGLGELWARINSGYVEGTPSGGLHWYYRVEGEPRRNTKLARRRATAEELAAKPGEKIKVLIETRGQGGFTVIAPSAGRTHPTGGAWTTFLGSHTTIPTITAEERDAVHAVASLLDAMPALDAPTPSANHLRDPNKVRPGDDYNQRATWDEILTPRGWTKGKPLGRDAYGWTRPGKELRDGISATTNTRDGADRLYVFSTSTEFESEKPYTKFAAYTLLEHNGDYAAAAKALAKDGYGDQQPISGGPEQIEQLVARAAPERRLAVVEGTSARILETLSPARIAQAYGPTEDGIARALADTGSDDLRYCPQRGMWLQWTGSRWAWDDAETHRERIRAIARELPEDDGWKAFKKRALSASGVTGIARLAQSDARLTVHIDNLDADPYQINTPGGIIDLRTGTISPPNPDALHTRSTSVAPDFTTTPKAFTTFLADTFGGDQDLAAYMQRLIGLSCIGTVLEQILPFAHGSGANGKSTLTEAVMHALGRGERGYAISAPSEMLMMRKHSEHPAELAQLAGARLVICSELDDGQRFAEARIKQLTGRDSINARFMRRDPFTFTPSHTIWLLGNHKPDATAGGPAFWRRVQLIPFENVVPEAKRDPHLGEKLEAEAPAILAWIAVGAASYLRDGLRPPTAVKSATADYAHEQDTVGRFVEERCHLVSSFRTSAADVRKAYESWCSDLGESPASAKRLTQELRRFGIEAAKGSKGRREYIGIGIATATQDDSEEWFK